MFAGYKYRTAKNLALMQMEQRGTISRDKLRTMSEIVINGVNGSYGRDLIKQRAAKNKHAAAAAVFARLAVAAERNPSGDIFSEDWQIAVRYALVNAGTDQRSSYLDAASLVSFYRDKPAAV